MAITTASLYPPKNSTGIPVDSNVTLRLESDFADMDVRSVKFYINDIEVKPSSRYSIDITYAEDKKKIDVTFFARRRIKFANERYGANDVRYGKMDTIPSSFLYGLHYSCKVFAKDENGLEYSDSFSFSTEEGVSVNETPETYFYSTTSQELANYLPDWTKARYDKFSNFQQIVNPASLLLEEIDNKIFSEFSNYFLQTANYGEMAVLHKADIGVGFNFKTTILDDGTSLQVPPSVAARTGVSIIYPTTEFSNDIKSFYYTGVPTRLETIKTQFSSEIILAKIPANILAIPLSVKLIREGTVCIKIEDGIQFVQPDSTGQDVLAATARIVGRSMHGKDQTEDILVIDNNSYVTKKRWSELHSVQFIYVPEESNIHFSIQYFPDVTAEIPDSFRYVSVDGHISPSFWSLDQTLHGSVMVQSILIGKEIDDIISSMAGKTAVNEYQLLDTDNASPLNLLGIVSDSFSNFIHGIDEDYLYIFDKREPYPHAVKLLAKNTSDPSFALELTSDNSGRGDTTKRVEIIGIQKGIGQQMNSYYLTIRYPNGTTEYILEDGTTTTNKSAAKYRVPVGNRQVETRQISLDLSETGDYVLSAIAQYFDGTTSVDSKIARVLTKPAIAKYKLGRILMGATPIRILRDFDGQIKIIDDESFLHCLSLVRDNMLVDYENGILYFNENYSEIKVDE
jgi:hypothetical protein